MTSCETSVREVINVKVAWFIVAFREQELWESSEPVATSAQHHAKKWKKFPWPAYLNRGGMGPIPRVCLLGPKNWWAWALGPGRWWQAVGE